MAWGSAWTVLRRARYRGWCPPTTAALLGLAAATGSSPAAAQAGGREVNAFAVTPRVGVVHDSNVFQLNEDRFSGDRSDTVVSPAVSVSFDRTIGRNSLSLDADVAYDFHHRYRSLDQVNLSATGSGTLAVSAYCAASPSGSLTVQQNNQAGAAALRNSQTAQNYSATLACRRPFGLFPSVSASYRSTSNSQDLLSLFDQHTTALSGGFGYAVPTIGSVLLSIGTTRIRQPNRAPGTLGNGSDVFNAGVSFDRAVAPRLSYSLAARYLSVHPLEAATPGYDGAGYNVSVNYHPSPRVTLVASAGRDATGTGDVAVSYVLASSYGLTGVVNLSPLTTFSLSAQHYNRTFKGENPLFFPVLRGSERGETLSGNISHTVAQRVQLSLFATYNRLNARSNFYDYTRLQFGLSAGARF